MVPHFTLDMLLRWDVGWGLEEKVGCMGVACVFGGGGVRWDRRTRRPTVPWPRRGGGMLVGGVRKEGGSHADTIRYYPTVAVGVGPVGCM
jgi:hypothetical protein